MDQLKHLLIDAGVGAYVLAAWIAAKFVSSPVDAFLIGSAVLLSVGRLYSCWLDIKIKRRRLERLRPLP